MMCHRMWMCDEKEESPIIWLRLLSTAYEHPASYDPSSTLTWHNSDLYSPSGKNDRAHSSIVLDCVRLLSDQLRVIGGHRQSLDHKINPNE